MAHPADDAVPSLAMVAAGGVGVLVVVAFVAVLAFGARPGVAGPGERVAVARQGPSGDTVVLAPRCRDDRVTGIEVAEVDGPVRWRITSRKGSIQERYVVGAEEVPLGFDVEVPLAGGLPAGAPLTARVVIDGEEGEVRDELAFTSSSLPEGRVATASGDLDAGSFQARALSAADCPESRSRLGLTTAVFAVAALGVVVTYALMVARWWGGRRR